MYYWILYDNQHDYSHILLLYITLTNWIIVCVVLYIKVVIYIYLMTINEPTIYVLQSGHDVTLYHMVLTYCMFMTFKARIVSFVNSYPAFPLWVKTPTYTTLALHRVRSLDMKDISLALREYVIDLECGWIQILCIQDNVYVKTNL